MKFAVIASAAALVAVTNAATCDVTALQTIITSPDAATCMTDSGFSGTTLVTPTDAELAKMCTSTACQSLLSDARAAAPTECTVGTFALYADLITPLNRVCSGGSSSGSSTSATVGSTEGSSATITANSTISDSSASASSSGSSSSASTAVVSVGAVLVAMAATFF
ncbi:hypothetical protein PInf_008029 [Phytophthora infestans]|nr:hypothetical protein PInf_008029 [Phytophthora infestans]